MKAIFTLATALVVASLPVCAQQKATGKTSAQRQTALKGNKQTNHRPPSANSGRNNRPKSNGNTNAKTGKLQEKSPSERPNYEILIEVVFKNESDTDKTWWKSLGNKTEVYGYLYFGNEKIWGWDRGQASRHIFKPTDVFTIAPSPGSPYLVNGRFLVKDDELRYSINLVDLGKNKKDDRTLANCHDWVAALNYYPLRKRSELATSETGPLKIYLTVLDK